MRRASHVIVGGRAESGGVGGRRQEEKDFDRKRLTNCILIRRKSGVGSRAMQVRRHEKNDPKVNEQGADGCKNHEAEMREGSFELTFR